MTNEERDLITSFIQRVGGAPAASGFGGSVPATTPALPPIDRDADLLIADLFGRYPEARYRLTQTAFVQEHALVEAQNQINQLQWQIQQLRQVQPPAPQQGGSPWGAAAQSAPRQAPPPQGMFGRLFGGGQPPPQQQPQYQQQQPQYAPPQQQFAPGYQPGMFQRQGSGFLGSALTTAAGVAGGMVAGNALMNMFSGNHGSGFGGGFGSGGGFAGPTATDSTPALDPYDAGGASKDSTWDNTAGGGGWQDPGAGSSGGWQDVGSSDPAPSDGGGWTDVGGSDDTSNT